MEELQSKHFFAISSSFSCALADFVDQLANNRKDYYQQRAYNPLLFSLVFDQSTNKWFPDSPSQAQINAADSCLHTFHWRYLLLDFSFGETLHQLLKSPSAGCPNRRSRSAPRPGVRRCPSVRARACARGATWRCSR